MDPETEKMMDLHTGWRQGRFIDGPQYKNISEELKQKWAVEELKVVRPGEKQNALCVCVGAEEAVWLAERLNFAARVATLLRMRDRGAVVTAAMDAIADAKKREAEAVDDLSVIAREIISELIDFVALKER
jgi:hypothetical protein